MIPYWRLSAYYFCYFAFIGSFSPYFTLYLQSLTFSASDIAILMSVMQVCRILAPSIWGWLSDRLGVRTPIIRLAGVVSAVGFGLFFITHSFGGLFVGMLLLAFFWSAALPLVEALTFSHLHAQPQAYSRIRLWGSVGFVVAVMVIGRALDDWPIATLLWMNLALLVGIAGCAFTLPEAAPRGSEGVRASLMTVLRRREVQALLGGCFMMSAAHGAYYVFYSILLVDLGYGKFMVGWLWTLGVLAEILVFMLMPRLMLHVRLRTILLVTLWCAVLRFLLMGWYADWWWVLVFAQLLHSATFGACHAAAIAAIHRWFDQGLQSRGQALYGSFSFGAGGLLGSLLAGACWDDVGAPWVFTMSAGFAVLGILWLHRGWQAGVGEMLPAHRQGEQG